MTEAPPITYRIEAVRTGHDRSAFDCGHPFLNTYLAQFARQNDQNGIARAYVMVPDEAANPVVGYYTLTAGAIAFDHLPPALRGLVEIIFTFGRTWAITAVLRFLARTLPLPAKRALH